MLMDQILKLSKIMSVGYLTTFGMHVIGYALLNHLLMNYCLFLFSRIGVDGMKMQVCATVNDYLYSVN